MPARHARAPGLTVKQPYAWAITYGGMDVLNKAWFTRHRGDFWLHAAARTRWSHQGQVDPQVQNAWGQIWPPDREVSLYPYDHLFTFGAIVATAGITGVHSWEDCASDPCSKWARPDFFHWQLAGVRRLEAPWPVRGWWPFWGTVPYTVDRGARLNLPERRHEPH